MRDPDFEKCSSGIEDYEDGVLALKKEVFEYELEACEVTFEAMIKEAREEETALSKVAKFRFCIGFCMGLYLMMGDDKWKDLAQEVSEELDEIVDQSLKEQEAEE